MTRFASYDAVLSRPITGLGSTLNANEIGRGEGAVRARRGRGGRASVGSRHIHLHVIAMLAH